MVKHRVEPRTSQDAPLDKYHAETKVLRLPGFKAITSKEDNATQFAYFSDQALCCLCLSLSS